MKIKLLSIRSLFSQGHVDGILITSVSSILYITGYSGFSPVEREAYLLITKKSVYLFTDGRYIEAVKTLKGITIKEITALSPLTKHMEEIKKDENLKAIGFEANNMTVSEYTMIKKTITLKSTPLHALRIGKANDEIKAIQKACTIGDKAFSYIISAIKTGMTEIEVSHLLEMFIKKENAALSFPSIVAFGKNSATPHHHTGEQKLKKNDIILLDFGVKYKNYCSDMTRTIFNGTPTKKQKDVYQTVLTAQNKAVVALQERITNASVIDRKAREYITQKGYPAFSHALGHGIGIEVHEAPTLSPRSQDFLKDSMVFSIEPGIYLSNNFGVRIEDLFTLKKDKLIQLTSSSQSLIQL